MGKSTKVKLNLVKKGKNIHPNSRKALKVVGAAMRRDRLKARKTSKEQKQRILSTKLQWFRDNLPENNKLKSEEIHNLIENYFKRFDEELNQISIVTSIKKRKPKQHAARRDVICHQIEIEKGDFMTCGFEIADLSCEENVVYLRRWCGDVNLLPNIKLKCYKKL